MNKSKFQSIPMLLKMTGSVLVALIIAMSCNTNDQDKKNSGAVVEIITKTMDFQSPDTITTGWHTFRYINQSAETHFFLLDKYPEGKRIEDAETAVAPVFQKGMDLIMAGKPDEAYAAFGALPEWFSKVVFSGGSGLVSPGKTAEVQLKIEPGYYVMECYVKMANGVFHTSMGMVKELVVLPAQDVSAEPDTRADVSINLSSTNGMELAGEFKKGKVTVEVNYLDQKVYENFVGHDVNLVKVAEGADLQVLEHWMNWANPDGLISPVPEGFTFLGGVNDMPAGSKAYFTAELEPGNYVLIAEVPDAGKKNLMQTFQVK